MISAKLRKEYFLALVFLLHYPTSVNAQEELLEIYGSEEMISLATGYSQPLNLAPSVATVITAEDIEKIGAVTLEQVLETAPGLHVSRSRIFNSIFVIRGIFSELNP